MKDLKICIPSSTEFIVPVVKFFEAMFVEKAFEKSLTMNIVTSVIEAVGNAIVHGNRSDSRKYVTITARIEGKSMTIEVHDEGRGFDIDALPDPLAPENLLNLSGRGLFLIRSFMDHVTSRFNGSGYSLCMNKTFEREIE
ncbi:anti-sigma regulatory factor [Candidatus Moduliflexus flocculans]|uniref:Anti-sigma regulatory factor n=1 Tax=Candidatus Moduliflexus flocculans TaxID=1499966 RepID=A0A0S6VZJ5_9BACT|nr:anti-sigma regulatory factor [Candidatus Moduliflexus flocculans]